VCFSRVKSQVGDATVSDLLRLSFEFRVLVKPMLFGVRGLVSCKGVMLIILGGGKDSSWPI
jgi:hypothetical protein